MGRWCFGDKLWTEYPDIGFQLHKRSGAIQTNLRQLYGSGQATTGEAGGGDGGDTGGIINPDVNEADTLDLSQLPTKQTAKVTSFFP